MRKRTSVALVIPAIWVILSTIASGQTASALIREGEPLPGGPPAHLITFINNTAVNHAGGYAASVSTSDGTDTLSRIWGDPSGGAGTVLRTEAQIGDLLQTSFESFYGMADDGQLGYSAISDDTVGGSTSLDGVWVDDLFVALEEEPVNSIPGQFWTFASRPSMTAGAQPFFVGGIGSVSGGSTENRGLFTGSDPIALLLGGQAVPGLPFVLSTSSTVSFDFRTSKDAAHYLTEVQMDSGSSSTDGAMVLDSAGLLVGGSLVREGDLVPVGAGGDGVENWDNFDFVGITESGSYLFTGDTDGSTSTDEIVVIDGQIVLREGDILDGETLTGSIEAGYYNENGDYALIWDVETDSAEALIYEGRILLREGDSVDLDGDGSVEPNSVVANFTGTSALTLGDRDAFGRSNLYFTADIDVNGTPSSSDDIEGFFCMLLPEIRLRTNLDQPAAGDVLEFNAWGGPDGNPVVLFAVALGGVPVFIPLASGTFDAAEDFLYSATVPTGLGGVAASFRAYGVGDGGKFRPSNDVTLNFQ